MGLSQKSVPSHHSRGTLEKEMSTTSGPLGPPGSQSATGGGSGTGGQNTPSTCHRQQSAPLLKGKLSKESSHVLSKQGSNVATMIDDMEYTGCNVAAKSVDLDEVDKESIHLLVFLFMQFLSCAEQAIIPEGKSDEGKGQSSFTKPQAPHEKAFQSLYSLLGYSKQDGRFTTMPHKIRCAPAVNSFFANLQQVLDSNYVMGEIMLLDCILILQKTPFPRLTSWQHQSFMMQEKFLFQGCAYSIWHLEPPMRKNWLTSVLVIAYKYNYNPDSTVGEKMVGLIRIIIHTLSAHAHVCDRYSKPYTGFAARSRDMSQLSLDEEECRGTQTNQDQTPQGETQADDDTEIANADVNKEIAHQEIEMVNNKERRKSADKEFKTEERKDEKFIPVDVEFRERRQPAVSPTDSYKHALRYSPPSGSGAGLSEAEQKMSMLFKQMESIESTDSDNLPEMANLFHLLPKPGKKLSAYQKGGSENKQSAPTPSDLQLTTGEGLPEGWAMQMMNSGRTLFIDMKNQVTTLIDPRTGKPSEIKIVHGMDGSGPIYVESPPSPLSLMDVITVGPSVPIVGAGGSNETSSGETFSRSIVSESSSSSIVTVASASHSSAAPILEPPPTERLLPIGVHPTTISRNTQCTREKMLDDQGRIFDRVWQVFGSMEKSSVDGYDIYSCI